MADKPPVPESVRDTIVALRRDIHRHPELSGEETETMGRIAAALHAAGIEHRTGVGGAGIVAGIGATDDAKCALNRECVDVKTMAFILVVANDRGIRQSTIDQVDNFRRAWEVYGNGPAVGDLGARGSAGDSDYIKKFDTSLSPVIH